MDPPHFLLDVLSDSISSGTFINTKFYVFSRRDACGRVHSPRALYCNSRILDQVPYFSSLPSVGFSDGQMKDINGGFPGSQAHTEDYDYLSDSDLEDGSFSEDREEEHKEGGDGTSQQGLKQVETIETGALDSHLTFSSLVGTTEARGGGSEGKRNSRMGKVAIIPDMAAVTFEALLYYLYTGEIKFTSLSSDPLHRNPAETRVGDWGTGRPPSPSAKSIYRLADKYDIPALKEQAKAHICNNLENCDIVEEVFSSFTYAFPEMLSIQVSFLVNKMNMESRWGAEPPTRKRLRNKIASLSRSQMGHATDALVMIWNRTKGPLEPPTVQSGFNLSATPILFPNWNRMMVAFLKSITTGVFIDVQFYAYNKIFDNIPLDPKPLFVSSIVIEEWGPTITTQTVRVGIDSKSASLADGPIDDYEDWHRVPRPETRRDETVVKHWTEASPAESREIVLLGSGAWKTWVSLFSYAYQNEVAFSPLRTSGDNSDSIAATERSRSCSPRSAYYLAETLGIVTVKENALKNIQSSLSASNIIQELFSSFTVGNEAVMTMEIEFFHKNIAQKDKLLMGYLQAVACGQTPFFPTTLSLVYDGLFGRVCVSPETSGVGKSSSVTTSIPLQASSSTPAVPSSSTTNANSSVIPTSTNFPLSTFTRIPSASTTTRPSAATLPSTFFNGPRSAFTPAATFPPFPWYNSAK